MLRTSRCIAGTLLQLGGPDALSSVVRYPCQFRFADLSFARVALRLQSKFLFATRANASARAPIFNAIHKSGAKLFAAAERTRLSAKRSTAQNLRGNLAMPFVAIG